VQPTLILVDDADTRADVISLLEQLSVSSRQQQVRMMMVVRDSGGLAETLRLRLSDRARLLLNTATIRLQAVGGIGDRSRWFTRAVRVFANALDIGTVDMTAEGATWLTAEESMLVLHARALAAVLGRDRTHSRWGGSLREVADELLDHEAHWWHQRATDPDHAVGELRPVERERAVLALTLLGAHTLPQAVAVLRRLPEFTEDTDASDRVLRNLTEWVRALYSDDGYAPRMRPDLLVARFTVSHLTRDRDLARSSARLSGRGASVAGTWPAGARRGGLPRGGGAVRRHGG
jgi:hypothetical protein